MANQKKFGAGILLRPLLSISREVIENYAKIISLDKEHSLKWVTDESNENLRFKRNVIRHEVLPILKEHFPGCLSTLARSSRLCAEESELLAELIQPKLLALVEGENLERFYFKREGFQQVSKKMQRQLIRVWLHQCLGQALNERHLGEIEKLLEAEHWSQARFEVEVAKGLLVLTREKANLFLRIIN